MANIDFLIQNSTKKILDLVKKLPERERLANAVQKSEHSSSSGTKRSRFQKHPRHFTDEDVVLTSEEDPPTTSFTHATSAELVVIKNPTEDKSPPLRSDSTDELCDITIRSDTGRPEALPDTPKDKPPMCIHADDESFICNGARRKDYSSTASSSKRVGASESKSESYLKFGMKNSELILPIVKAKTRKVKKEREELKVVLDPKIKNLIERSIHLAAECRTLFQNGVPAPDGDDDYQRRKKRTVEFSSRFSRNYLYNLNRTITDIDVAIQAASVGRFTTKNTNSFVLSHKFFTAFQTISLALDAYTKHLPTSIVKGMPDKFKELMNLVFKLLTLFRVVGDYVAEENNVIDIFENFCKTLMFDDVMNLPTPPGESTSTASASQPKPVRETKRQGDGVTVGKVKKQSRLSMYSVPQRKDAYWKNAVAALAKKKYQVQSKYKTATFKHRPPPEPPAPAPPPPPLKLATKRDKKRKSRSAKLGVIDIDKNVRTFVEGEVSSFRDQTCRSPQAPRSSPVRKPNALKAHAEAFYEKVTKDKLQKMNINEYECILDHFLEAVGMEHPSRDGAPKEVVVKRRLERKFGKSIEDMPFQEFVDNIINYANRTEQIARSPTSPTRRKKSEKRAIKKAKKSAAAHLTAQAEESHAEGPPEIISQMQQLDPIGHLRHRLSDLSISDGDVCNKLIYKERNENEEMQSKLDSCSPRKQAKPTTTIPGPRVPEVLKMLPKETILGIIEYKLLYHKESRQNFMYTVTDDATPWLLVESVGDALLEEMLSAVSRDIQVDKILKKIYAQEFK